MKNVWKVIESTPAQCDVANVENPEVVASYVSDDRKLPVIPRGTLMGQELVTIGYERWERVGWLGMFNLGVAFGYCLKWWIGVTN